jgi:hypothetical protein
MDIEGSPVELIAPVNSMVSSLDVFTLQNPDQYDGVRMVLDRVGKKPYRSAQAIGDSTGSF